jgi:hypothetical protein
MAASYIWILLLLPYVLGNTEKTIFLGPSPVNVQLTHPTLDGLQLDTLTPNNFTIRTHLKAQFPNNELRDGKPSWFVLRNLTQGQRYEVRVCWAATVSQANLVFRSVWMAKDAYSFPATNCLQARSARARNCLQHSKSNIRTI